MMMKKSSSTSSNTSTSRTRLNVFFKALQQNCLTFLATRWGMTLVFILGFLTLNVLLYSIQGIAFVIHSSRYAQYYPQALRSRIDPGTAAPGFESSYAAALRWTTSRIFGKASWKATKGGGGGGGGSGTSTSDDNANTNTNYYSEYDFDDTADATPLGPDYWRDNIGGKSYRRFLLPDPIDIVYTWVNGSDPEHVAALKAVMSELGSPDAENDEEGKKKDGNSTTTSTTTTASSSAATSPNTTAGNSTGGNETAGKHFKGDDVSTSRFKDNNELRYSLRSVEKYAPWVRRIWLVTNGQVPSWLNLNHPRLRIVTHKEIFPNASHLPTFSSPAIETHLHRIPGLSSRFIYLNDDVMFGAPVWPDDFYTVGGGQKVFFAWPVPNCAPGCPSNWVGDGFCDQACNVSECDYDNGDCFANSSSRYASAYAYGYGYGAQNWAATESLRVSSYCTRSCPDSWLGDKFCDKSCNVPECGYDLGDCKTDRAFAKLPGLAPENGGNYTLPTGTRAAYFNLSALLGSVPQPASIVDGDHGNTALVRSAAVSLKANALFVSFRNNVTNATNITLSVESGSQEYNLTFTINVNTTWNESNVLSSSSSSSSSSHPAPTPTPPGEAAAAASSSSLGGVSLMTQGMPVDPPGWNASNATNNDTKAPAVDTFGESLKYVNRLYSKTFRPEVRKVPAHMPHFIRKDVMEELQARFPGQFEETSSHKLRSPRDMQYAFSYMYYIIDMPAEFNFSQTWSEYFDTDASGELDENEFWTLLVYLCGGTPTPAELNRTLAEIANCTGKKPEDKLWPVRLAELARCNETAERLRKSMDKRKYRHEEFDSSTVGFVMVWNNDTTLQGKLDGIRFRRHKFICLNDNVDHSSPEAPKTLKMLHDFYESLYPKPSSFELPAGVTNPYLHVDEFKKVEHDAPRGDILVYLLMICAFTAVLFYLFRCVIASKRKMGRARKGLSYKRINDV